MPERDVGERRREVAVDHPHHLLGRDPVGDHARDEGAGAGADVDVELVDRPVDGEQVQRPQGPDLVHAAGEPATAEDERGLGLTPATSLGPSPPATPSAASRARRPSPWLARSLCTGRAVESTLLRAGQEHCESWPWAPSCALFGGGCTGGRVDLARPPGARAGEADATGRRRQRSLGLRPRRARPRPAVQLGVEAPRARSPRTRSCSRRRRCSTGSGANGRRRDHGLSAEALGPPPACDPRATWCWSVPATRRSRAAASPSTTTCPLTPLG